MNINYEEILKRNKECIISEDGNPREQNCMKESVRQAIRITLQDAADKAKCSASYHSHEKDVMKRLKAWVRKDTILSLEGGLIKQLTE